MRLTPLLFIPASRKRVIRHSIPVRSVESFTERKANMTSDSVDLKNGMSVMIKTDSQEEEITPSKKTVKPTNLDMGLYIENYMF